MQGGAQIHVLRHNHTNLQAKMKKVVGNQLQATTAAVANTAIPTAVIQ